MQYTTPKPPLGYNWHMLAFCLVYFHQCLELTISVISDNTILSFEHMDCGFLISSRICAELDFILCKIELPT